LSCFGKFSMRENDRLGMRKPLEPHPELVEG